MRRLLFVLLVAVASYLIVTLPFFLKIDDPIFGFDFSKGTTALWENYDGPNYIVVAKSFYDKEIIRNNFSLPLPLEYYPAHFPLYPGIIAFFDVFMPGPWAMLAATALGYILLMLVFYKYLRLTVSSRTAILLVVVLAIFPARWLVLRAIGSPEPWFMMFILMSLTWFRQKRFALSAIGASLAILTKSPGVLLPIAYGIEMMLTIWKTKKINWQYGWYALTILTVVVLFGFYKIRMGDFWAYFNSGDNFHILWPPFAVFSKLSGDWVGSFWLEDIIYIWLFFGFGVLNLKKLGYKIEYIFGGIFWLVTLFVSHRDISRYIMPILPLVILGYKDVLKNKQVRKLILILAIPGLIFAWNYILNNREIINDWSPFL